MVVVVPDCEHGFAPVNMPTELTGLFRNVPAKRSFPVESTEASGVRPPLAMDDLTLVSALTVSVHAAEIYCSSFSSMVGTSIDEPPPPEPLLLLLLFPLWDGTF